MKKTWKNKMWIYAMYKGDECLAIGTIDEICEKMNITKNRFHFMRTKYYINMCENRSHYSKGYRTIIRIDED